MNNQNLLTQQQYKIACLAASGKTRKDIADECYLSIRTVDSHLGLIYKKLNIKGLKALPLALQQLSAHKLADSTWDDKLDYLCNYPMTISDLMKISGCSRTIAREYLTERGLLISDHKGCKGELKKLAEDHDLPYNTVWGRVTRLGWSLEDALTTPVRVTSRK